MKTESDYNYKVKFLEHEVVNLLDRDRMNKSDLTAHAVVCYTLEAIKRFDKIHPPGISIQPDIQMVNGVERFAWRPKKEGWYWYCEKGCTPTIVKIEGGVVSTMKDADIASSKIVKRTLSQINEMPGYWEKIDHPVGDPIWMICILHVQEPGPDWHTTIGYYDELDLSKEERALFRKEKIVELPPSNEKYSKCFYGTGTDLLTRVEIWHLK